MKQIFIFADTEKDTISYFEYEPAILISMNRSDLPYLKEQDFADFSAVYVLIGGDKRYVGQAAGQTIAKRLSQHFSNDDKAWVESVIFFSRTDGKMSKADTDYLEKKLIQEFKEKSEFNLMNSTTGNTSHIDKLQKAKSDQLYDTVFEIIDEIANIDLFGVAEEAEDASSVRTITGDVFEIEYNGKKIESNSARGLFIDFVKDIVNDAEYENKIKEIIIDNSPTSSMILGRKASTYNGRDTSAEIADAIFLYTNFSRKSIKEKIEKFSEQMGLTIKLKWI